MARVEIDIFAKDKTGSTLKNLSQNMQGIGQGLSNALAQPLADLGRMILKNEEVEKSLEPIKTAWGDVLTQLSESLIPVIEEVTPALITLADTTSKLIDGFNDMDPGAKSAIAALVGLVGILGPVISFVGTLFSAVSGLVSAWGTLSTILAPIISTVLPAIGAALAAISAPVWLLIGAIVILGATIAIFGKDAWNTLTMIVKILDVLIQRAADAIAALSLFNGTNTGVGTNWTGSNFGGRANGGNIMAGMPKIVGELGPELFVPSSNGSIIPHDKIGSFGSQSVNNITVVYSPQMSLASSAEVKRNLVPLIRQAMRTA